jgi:DNA invertase Pin-like site-specific DNA recombinase
MAALRNSKHEAFAQQLVLGQKHGWTRGSSYSRSGFKTEGKSAEVNASRLLSNAKNGIAERVREIVGRGAAQAAVTVESLLSELDMVLAGAVDDRQFGAARAAIDSKARLKGLFVDKLEIAGAGEFSLPTVDAVLERVERELGPEAASVFAWSFDGPDEPLPIDDLAKITLQGRTLNQALARLEQLREALLRVSSDNAQLVEAAPDVERLPSGRTPRSRRRSQCCGPQPRSGAERISSTGDRFGWLPILYIYPEIDIQSRGKPMARKGKPVEAVAYIRTSSATNVGAGKDSDKRQRAAITAFARHGGFVLVDEFNDQAVKGDDPIEARPGFSALLDRIEGNGVRTVIVEDASRLARSLIVQELGILALITRGVRVLTASGDNLTDDSDPSRTMMRQIAGAFHQYEKARLVAKLKAARERKRGQGKKVEGRRSWTERAQKDAKVAELLQAAKELRGTSLRPARSLREIAAELEKRGYVNERGVRFSPPSVASMLR